MARKILSFLFLASLCCGPALARRPNDVTITYFADASLQKIVGEVEYPCGGGKIRHGRITAFYKPDSASCSARKITYIPPAKLARLRDSYHACLNICQRKHPRGPCLPDGTCPSDDALADCAANCQPVDQPANR